MERQPKKEADLSRRCKMGLSRVHVMYKPTVTIPVLRAKLRKENGVFGSLQFRFGIKKAEAELWFASDSEQERDEWYEAIQAYMAQLELSLGGGLAKGN